MNADTTPRFRFWPFAAALGFILGLVGGLNYLIDPLWYVGGNRLTGKNFPFNERIAKVNLLNRTLKTAGYDCLILGSSRVIALRPSQFKGLRCFNLALKGAEVAEFLAYARFARDAGLQPKTVFVSVDDFNFVDKPETARRANPVVKGSEGPLHAFLSADVLVFSLMTLAGVSPDPSLYYDPSFEAVEAPGAQYAAQALEEKADLACKLDKVAAYGQLREVFPSARLVGYAAPMTPWYKLSDEASRGLLDCSLSAYHAVAQSYDDFLDFTLPTPLTEDPRASYDGTHFSPAANDQVAARLSGVRDDLALDVKAFTLDQYRTEVQSRLRDFLIRQGRQDFLPVAGL